MTIREAAEICVAFARIREEETPPKMIMDASVLPWKRDVIHQAFDIFIAETRRRRDTQGHLFKLRGDDVALNNLEVVSCYIDDYVDVEPQDKAAVEVANRVGRQDPSTWTPEVWLMLEKYSRFFES